MSVPGVQGGQRLTWTVQCGLLAGPFLSMVDSNVVNVAIPRIARSFASPLSEVQWAVSVYLLAMATGLGATSYLAKRWGTRPVYLVSLVGFTVASIACALAGSTAWLISARLAQGLLGAPLVPLAMGMLLGGEGASERLSPAAGIVLFLAPALGPSLGGIVISNFGWQSVFLLNVPFAAVGFVGVLNMSPQLAPGREPGARLDPVGLLGLSAGLALTTYGASQGPAAGWGAASVWPFWGAGLVLLALDAVWAGRREHPAVSLEVLASRRGALAIGLSVIAGLVLFAVLFLIPVFVQNVQGLSATAAGLVLLPQGLVLACGTVLGDLLSKRGLVRRSVIGGTVVLALATGALVLIASSTPAWATAALLCGRGLALGLIIQPLVVATLGGLPATKLADANTLFNVVERIAGSFGVALLATFFQVRARSSGPTQGFHATVWVLVALSAVAFLGSLFLGPDGAQAAPGTDSSRTSWTSSTVSG